MRHETDNLLTAFPIYMAVLFLLYLVVIATFCMNEFNTRSAKSSSVRTVKLKGMARGRKDIAIAY